jgi:hypothetical protein
MNDNTANSVFATMVDYLLQSQADAEIIRQGQEIEIYNELG